jgi:hypothetical protein
MLMADNAAGKGQQIHKRKVKLKASKKNWNALTIEHGIISTYKHTGMLKINNSYVKICECSCCLLAVFVSIVTHAVVTGDQDTHTQAPTSCCCLNDNNKRGIILR